MAVCGYPPPEGCACQCGAKWLADPYLPVYDIVCQMHDLGEECSVCGPHKLYDPKERRAV